VAVALPQDSVGIIAARSGLALRSMVAVLGGIIDPDYRGELQVILANLSGTEHVTIRAGDRIAQLLIMQAPQLDVIEVATLDATERDASGFGSSGR
jgi:dUTP pyrophosphatase